MANPTTNLGMTKPTVGGSTDTWGTTLNENVVDIIDALFSISGTDVTMSDIKFNSMSVQETGAGTDTVKIQAPAAVTTSYTLTMPAAVGSANQVLSASDGSGTLAWTTPETGDITGITAGAGMTGGGTSGDVTLDVVGTADRITANAHDIDIASTYVGQTSITTLGTVATGVWSGTTVAVNKGGTGLASYAAGDVIYASGATTLAKLAKGSDTEVLTLASGVPTWAAPTVGDITQVAAGDGLSGGGSSGSVTLALDLNELTAATVDVAADFIAIVDTNDSNTSRKESIVDLIAAIDGTGLTASSGVLAVDAAQTQITSVGALGAGSITSGFGAIDVGSSSIDGGTITGTFSGNITGNVTGNCSGSAGSATGNAATATALQTARTIGGTSFDGTANIAVALSATTTALATARAINGVDFDGTAAVTITAAAGTVTGATLNSGVTASSLTSVGTLASVGVTGATSLGNRIDHYTAGTGGTLAAQYGSGNDIGLGGSGGTTDFNIKAVGEFAVSAGASSVVGFLLEGAAASIPGTLSVVGDLTTASDVIIGTLPANTGDIRINKNFAIKCRDTVNSTDKMILSEATYVGEDDLCFGDNLHWDSISFHAKTLNIVVLTASLISLNKATTMNNAAIKMTGLVTSDPGVAGQLWNDSNTVKISAG